MRACIKKLNENCKIPERGSEKAAGYDLFACLDGPITIMPQRMVKVGTGLAITPPAGFFGAIFARSGMATKRGLRPANCVGACDYDYTGEYIVALYNDSDEEQIIYPGDKIAQLIFLPYLDIMFEEVDELETTERADGGFGHTGM